MEVQVTVSEATQDAVTVHAEGVAKLTISGMYNRDTGEGSIPKELTTFDTRPNDINLQKLLF